MKRTYLCLPGAWMGAWSWQFVLERLRAAGHDARALPFRGVGERAAELAPELDNDVFLADTRGRRWSRRTSARSCWSATASAA